MGTTSDIAEWIHRTNYDEFGPDLIKYTKDLCLNFVGGSLGGSVMRVGKSVIRYIKECRAPSEAGVIGAGFRSSAEYAAFANGATYHVTELEDDAEPESTYTCGVLPAAFALGEKLHLSGKKVIEGIVLGYEPAVRLSGKCYEMMRRGLLTDSYFGCIGVAGMAAKMLKLTVEETTAALSIAASQSCGLLRQTGTGAHLVEAGFPNRNGICAAMLAKQGITGLSDILEAPHGLCYAVAGVTDLGDLRLGRPFYFDSPGVIMKKYPVCSWQHHIINGFLEFKKKSDIRAEHIESIEVHLHPEFLSAGPCRYHHPLNQEQTPFSVPHTIAVCFLRDRVSLESYTDEAAQDSGLHAFREKVKMVEHPEWEPPHISGEKFPIVIKLKDGTEHKAVFSGAVKGIRLSDDELMDRYMDCALRVLSRRSAEEGARMILTLDKVKDVSEVMDLFTFGRKNKNK